MDALGQAALRGVLPREGKRVRRTVQGVDPPGRSLGGEGQRDGAGTRA